MLVLQLEGLTKSNLIFVPYIYITKITSANYEFNSPNNKYTTYMQVHLSLEMNRGCHL